MRSFELKTEKIMFNYNILNKMKHLFFTLSSSAHQILQQNMHWVDGFHGWLQRLPAPTGFSVWLQLSRGML